MNTYISVSLFYSNNVAMVKRDMLLLMEAIVFVCNDKENGIEFQVECVEQESEDVYSIQILVEDWLFKGIENTLNNPTKVIIGIDGEEVELNVDNLSVVEVLELDNDEF